MELGLGTCVGLGLGAAVGKEVGMEVGDGLGEAVGAGVGKLVGDGVGPAVGAGVGPEVGVEVGPGVGDGNGAADGSWVGDHVGGFDGSRVGAIDGIFDGSAVGIAVGAGVRSVGIAVGAGVTGAAVGGTEVMLDVVVVEVMVEVVVNWSAQHRSGNWTPTREREMQRVWLASEEPDATRIPLPLLHVVLDQTRSTSKLHPVPRATSPFSSLAVQSRAPYSIWHCILAWSNVTMSAVWLHSGSPEPSTAAVYVMAQTSVNSVF